jgi:photosystem II stability/assembly factor-like uncharacterized protein
MAAVLLAGLAPFVAAPAHAAPASDRPLHWTALNEPGNGGRMTAVRVSPHDPDRILIAGDMLGAALSIDGGESWLPTFGFKSYEQGDITWHPTDPDVVWIGTMSGPYVSHDGGANWEERRVGMPEIAGGTFSAPIEKILFDPNDEQRLIAVGGSSRGWREFTVGQGSLWGTVWESTDGGGSWEALNTLTRDGYVSGTSEDGQNITAAAFAPGSSDTLYVAGKGIGFRVSHDGGRTWEDRTDGLPHDSVLRLQTHPTDGDRLWVSLLAKAVEGADALPGGIFGTDDAGQTWTPLNDGLTQRRSPNPNRSATYHGFVVSQQNPDLMYASDRDWTVGVIYRSTDGGASWKAIATKRKFDAGPDAPIHIADMDTSELVVVQDFAYRPGLGAEVLTLDPNDDQRLFGITSSELVVSEDGGRSYEFPLSPLVESETEFGPTWRGAGYSGLVGKRVMFDPFAPGRVILQGMDQARIWLSNDDLQSWSYHGEDPNPWAGGEDVVFAGDGHIYAIYGQGKFAGIGRSFDDGRTWQAISGPEFGLPAKNQAKRSSSIYAHPDDPQRIWAVVDQKLYTSEDAGDSWNVIFEGAALGFVRGDPNDANRLWVSSDVGIWMSTDGGKSFANIGGPELRDQLYVDHTGMLFALAFRGKENGGVWRYDGGDNWTRIFDDPYAAVIAVDPFDENRMAVSTADRPYHDHTWATGVYLSEDRGQTWISASDGLPVLRGEALAFDPHNQGRLILGTGGRGFWITHWPAGLTLTQETDLDQADFVEDFTGDLKLTLDTNTAGAGWTVADGVATIDQLEPFGNYASAAVELEPTSAFTASAELELKATDYSNGMVELVALAEQSNLGGSWQSTGVTATLATEYGPVEYRLIIRRGKDVLAEQKLDFNPSKLDKITLTLTGSFDADGLKLVAGVERPGRSVVSLEHTIDNVTADEFGTHHGLRTIVNSKNPFTVAVQSLSVDLDAAASP